MPAVTLSQLESHLWKADRQLKGLVDAADFKTVIVFRTVQSSGGEAGDACRTQKSKSRCGKSIFINAVNEVTRERAQSFLTDEHLQRIVRAYLEFQDEPGFTRVVPIEEIRAKEGNLSIPFYVGGETQAQMDAATKSATKALPDALSGWLESSASVRQSLQSLLSGK